MVWVTIQLGKGYIADLKKRMKHYKISQGELARAMELGEFGATHVSRYFTKNDKRRISPTLETAEKMELAMQKLIRFRDTNSPQRRSHNID